MAREQVHALGFSEAGPEAVWAIARDFCGMWQPGLATMLAERGPNGALIRAFTAKGEGKLYREQVTCFSDSDRSYAYRHLAGIEGAQSHNGRLTVAASERGGAVITMTASLSAASSRRAAEIAAGTKAIFDDAIAALGKLAEAGAGVVAAAPLPPPVPVETMTIDALPRLALSVSPARSGPLVLFLHGIGGGPTNRDKQLGTVGNLARAAALDLRGYGDSTLGPRQSTVDDYCADILRVREVLGAGKLVLVGLSYGSWIATSFAMHHGDLLAGLVLSGGCTGMSEAGPEEREAFRVSREVPLNAGQVPADFAPAVVKVLASPDAPDAVRHALLESMAAIPAPTCRDALLCFTNPLERFDFAKLTMPVLMMTGVFDRLAPPDEIRGVAGRILDQAPLPDVRFEVIAGAGHVCNVEAPRVYSRHLLDFVAKVTP